MTDRALPRRAVVALAGSAAALPLLSACGGGSTAAAPASPTTPAGRHPSHARRRGGPGSMPSLVAASEVPVGGALVVPAASLVVTQPAAGQYRCFSSICTHAGCPVAAAGTTLRCPCHGSQFSITDGSVLVGPATSPLPERQIRVSGGEIRLA